ncbi:hypothetical protein MRX96_052405 [Rhipicephalus microplus]
MPVISSPFEAVLKVEEFSSCSRVVRLTAWVRRFVNNCRRGKERKGGPLRAEEVIDAERYWLTTTQGEAFSDDISNLKAQRPLHKGSPVLPLSPYLDGEGLMRVGGRLQFTDNHEETKHPIILPSTHPFTLLLIRKRARENATLRGARHLGVIARVVLDHPRAPGRKKGYQAVPHLSQTKLPSSHGTSGTTSS